MKNNEFRLSVRLTAGALVVMVLGALLEGGGRIVYAFQDEIAISASLSPLLQRMLVLDPYEMPASQGGFHWTLRPGYRASAKEFIDEKKRSGQRLLVGPLHNALTAGNDGVFRINADGFKGPKLDRSGTRPRILALGDSTTFGVGATDYPRRLEADLNRRGLAAEVVNGGVEGYFPRSILYEMERYKSLKPDIVILYIGWNELFLRIPWTDSPENMVRFVWLTGRARKVLKTLATGPQAQAFDLMNRKPKPQPDAREVTDLGIYVPPFMDRIERIVNEFDSIGSEIFLVTLPGLFVISDNPSPRALEIGTLPHYTDNPFVLAKLTDRYNAALRSLAIRRGLGVIDLEKWSARAFEPRDAFFLDSVHLTTRGLEMIGDFMGDQLSGRVKKLQRG